jgi:hypothetical protein
VRDTGGLDHPRRLELDRPGEVLEEADPGAEQHRHEVNLKVVEEPRREELLRGARAP